MEVLTRERQTEALTCTGSGDICKIIILCIVCLELGGGGCEWVGRKG